MAKVSLRAYNREIETMTDRGQLDEAIANCIHIFKTFPKHLETYRLFGKVFLEYKRYKDAVDIFSRVLVAVPNDFVAQVGMSIIRDEENKLDDAIWHMERAFETQPSNSAIQGELQRLYGRRDGVQPPRIRMTRGALAHMYVQGELYPQAISEIKSVLKEDAGRSDMQALLARAYYRSGQKNEAAEVASTLLRRYPYCLDANRVLVEILSVDRPENAQVYRQRVFELDPYAAHVNGTVFQSNEVSDAAVSLEHLDWNGQPVGTQAEWRDSQAIRLESGTGSDSQAQPDWLKSSIRDTSPTDPPQPKAFDQTQGRPASAFEMSAPPSESTPSEDIPDFMRAAGWGQSTGAFDESKPAFSGEASASAAQPIEQGDLPDWVKAMAPAEASQPAQPPAEEEEMPDWINKIGTGSMTGAAASSDESDWMSQLGQPSQPSAQPSDDQPDWLKQFESPASSSVSSGQPDWLKDLGSESQPESTSPQTPSEEPDWLKGFGDEAQSTPAQIKSEEPDWLSQFDVQPQPSPSTPSSGDFDFLDELTAEPQPPASPAPVPSKVDTGSLGTSDQERDDSFAWLEGLAAKQGASEGLLTNPEERLEEEPDWVKQAKGMNVPSEQTPVQQTPLASQPVGNLEELGKSEQERDDSFAWLEGLAAKQGANEGLLTKPEERLEQEPDWVKQAKDLGAEQPETQPSIQPEQQPSSMDDTTVWLRGLDEEELEPLPTSANDETAMWLKGLDEPEATPSPSQPVGNLDELGKSEQERDDSFSWLESLAAKQGASEGLLTKPEERMEQEPDWVKKVKSTTGQLSEQKMPETVPPQMEESTHEPLTVEPPAASVEELGKSDQERDDSFAWLENLAAKQGASEGLLTTPEERLEAEPDWVKQAKDLAAAQPPALPPVAEPEQQPSTVDDTAAWLRSLDEEEFKPAPTSANDETAMWLKSLDEPEVTPPAPVEPVQSDVPAWMQNIEEEETVKAESAVPASDISAGTSEKEAEDSEWLRSIEEEPVIQSSVPIQEEPKSEAENLPGWLSGLDKEEEQEPISIPASQDDLPAWLRDETGEVVAEPTKIEPTRATDWQPVEEVKQEEIPVPPPPVVQAKPEPKPEPEPEPKPAKKALAKTEVKPATPPEPYKEPVTRRGTGMLTMAIDPILHSSRTELSRSNIPGALEMYGKLIKKGRFLDEVIFDLREALYRYPVEVSIWQSLGDAYMRANRLQDALDAYTKAEELLR